LKKERADKVLVEKGLAETRQRAQALIMAGLVSGPAGRIEKAGQPVDPAAELTIAKPLPYVGRGGFKLEQALDVFVVSPQGLVCADIGSSTGGFTDCLLQRGAARVFAVDVDIRQLDDRVRRNPRVITIQKNARNLVAADFPATPVERPVLYVMDVSFISILKILPALRGIVSNTDGEKPILLTLIKPQFEAGRGQVGKKGIVREPALHAEILARVAAEAGRTGFALRGLVLCRTHGRTGNREFFARWEPGGMEPPAADVLKWIEDVVSHETD
jgi:23S rRNA (cytidine1920-2'-O)/16S rRNA (cytidine1409-2'-O)-methyltransferase